MKNKLTVALMILLCFGCISHTTECQTEIRYKKYDLFSMSGIESKEEKEAVHVDICYVDSIPIEINFVLPNREVKLVLDSTFFDKDSVKVFKYTTSNLLGGPPGRNRVHIGHSIEYRYELYIDLSSQIVIRTFNLNHAGKQIPFDIAMYRKLDNDSIEWTEQFVSTSNNYHSKLQRMQSIKEYQQIANEYLDKTNEANGIERQIITSIIK